MDESVVIVAKAAERAKRGSWPILAGWLEQSHSLLAAVEMLIEESGECF